MVQPLGPAPAWDIALALGTSAHGFPSELLPYWEKPCSNSYHKDSFSFMNTLIFGDDSSLSDIVEDRLHMTSTLRTSPLGPAHDNTSCPDDVQTSIFPSLVPTAHDPRNLLNRIRQHVVPNSISTSPNFPSANHTRPKQTLGPHTT